VIAADRACKGNLHNLACLNPEPLPADGGDNDFALARAACRQYLENECGFIHLDGLPADNEVGSRRLRLENLLVPAHLDLPQNARQPVGTILAGHPRLALLAAPGAGKSTLLKRLAVAYIDPARREQIADDLPPREWLPLFFRCRELRALARGSFADLIEALSQREPLRLHAHIFRALVDRELSAGKVLLLIDGLDEISDVGDRAAFVCTLRSALQAYPGVAIVVTSREAGYRHVAAHLAPLCTTATLSPFDADDIRRLTVAWYVEVVGDTEKNRTDAEQLAATIAKNDRIKRLAVNPLLLTTLLLVKRWVGALPTRRAVLYGKAVEVLLMTWNTEGHEPIPDDEALPQLCCVASAMMLNGVQKVSRRGLAAWLREAREVLPAELGYVKGSVDEFIHRVEDRSSLLMMTGYDVEDGQLAEFFEFRHLTFQEFLTAKAMVEGWHPGRRDEDTLASVLAPYYQDNEWQEVIPLAASQGGKATDALIQSLTAHTALTALGNCLADEVAARRDTIGAAVSALVRHGDQLHEQFVQPLMQGRYGAHFREEAGNCVMSSEDPDDGFQEAANALSFAVYYQTVGDEDEAGYRRAAEQFREMLTDPDKRTRVEGALGAAMLCLVLRRHALGAELTCALGKIGDALIPMLFSGETISLYTAACACYWLGECGAWCPPVEPDVLQRLWMLWRGSPVPRVRGMAASTLSSLPLQPRDKGNRFASVPPGLVEVAYSEELGPNERIAALVAAWYTRALPDEELAECAEALNTGNETLTTLLKFLGRD